MKARVIEQRFTAEVAPARPVSLDVVRALDEGLTVEQSGSSWLLAPERGVRRTDPLNPYNPIGRRLVDFKPDPDFPGEITLVDLPVLRLHCPKHEGCKASETLGSSSEETTTVDVAVLGVGFGGHVDLTLEVSSGWETENGDCLELAVPAELKIELGQYVDAHGAFSTAFRVTVGFIDDAEQTQRSIAPARDVCTRITEWRNRLTSVQRRTLVESRTRKFGLKAGTKVAGTTGIEFDLLKDTIGVQLTYERAMTTTISREYELAAGAAYQPFIPAMAQSPQLAAEVFWETTPTG